MACVRNSWPKWHLPFWLGPTGPKLKNKLSPSLPLPSISQWHPLPQQPRLSLWRISASPRRRSSLRRWSSRDTVLRRRRFGEGCAWRRRMDSLPKATSELEACLARLNVTFKAESGSRPRRLQTWWGAGSSANTADYDRVCAECGSGWPSTAAKCWACTSTTAVPYQRPSASHEADGVLCNLVILNGKPTWTRAWP